VSVTATTGAVRLLGFNQLPRAGTNRNTGAVLDGNTPLPGASAMDSATLYSHVQIGHGQSAESAPLTGAGISTDANLQGFFIAPATVANLYDASNATFANPAFTTPGTSVRNVRPEMSTTGDISVFAGGTVQVRDNMGYDAAGNWTGDPGPGIEPYLTAGGILRDVGIEVRAGNQYFSYGMIGHGGTQTYALETFSTGFNGNIDVEADKGGVLFVGGEEKRAERTWGYGYNFVQVGHGGINVQGTEQGNITLQAGQGVGAVDGDVIFRSGRMRQSYAQVGHGGQGVTRAITGNGLSDIIVTAKGDLEFTSRASGPSNVVLSGDFTDIYQVETGSAVAGNAEWAERVVGTLASGTEIPQTNSIQSNRFDTNEKYVMLGHGGNNVNYTGDFSLNNTITVTSQDGSVRFTAGDNDRDFAMIGMGGYRSGGAPNIFGADITVTADADVILDASNPGGNMVERTTMMGIPVRNGLGQIIGLGQMNDYGRGFAHFAMIGNGGYDMDGDQSGTITINAGGDVLAIAPKLSPVATVTGYTGGTIEGPSNFPASGVQNYWIGNAHALTALQEASMMQRSFQLYHGNSGASQIEHRGNVVAGSVSIDIGGSGGADLFDFDNGDGTGTLKRGADRTAAAATTVSFGTISYTTGKVTVNTTALSTPTGSATGDLEDGTGNFQRNIDYQYTHPTIGTVTIGDERTPESDMAIRPNETYLGHGRLIPGSVVLNVGGTIYRKAPGLDGTIRDAANNIFARIDYSNGRVRFAQNVNPTGGPVSADYQWRAATPIPPLSR
jgi:hypothetical protein